ncbi:MerR family transcriptional regulator [Catelliglobosispora koreensis]|uniref:MerR family transcriptional regulator n=1 Tax=Catelliglobosispora koreensis TaxID=129052 RepID=UPI000375495B|nr:MerR family transcriptional regulator [Catelliglobosispora koreensis]
METVGLSAGAVSRRLGIAVTTLRTWHQRYGLGPSGHEAGSHRRYTESDVERLEWMRQLTAQGVPAAEAARVVTSPRDESLPLFQARAGGGHAIPVGQAGSAARGLANAAMRLDQAMVRHLVQEAVDTHGVSGAWAEVLCPVLIGIGKRHAATNELVEVEHLLSRSIGDVLGSVSQPPAQATVLLACADEEQHSLALEALAAALAERGMACRMLGARVPTSALLAAVRRTGPAVVVLWSHAHSTGDPAQLEALLTTRPRPVLVLAAGPGWPARLPAGVLTPSSLADALALITPVI